MLSPSFCQVMLGWGMPEATQESSTSSATSARTTLGRGFTTGEAARERGGGGAPRSLRMPSEREASKRTRGFPKSWHWRTEAG